MSDIALFIKFTQLKERLAMERGSYFEKSRCGAWNTFDEGLSDSVRHQRRIDEAQKEYDAFVAKHGNIK